MEEDMDFTSDLLESTPANLSASSGSNSAENSNTSSSYEQRFGSLKDLFCGNLFVVPDFQRGYDWEESNCRDLWNDIITNLEAVDAGDHYMSTVVVSIPNDGSHDSAESLLRYHVIDGQQRLTTTTLLLYTLHQFVHDSDLKNEIWKSFITANTPQGEEHFRLVLNSDMRDFFERILKSTLEIDEKLKNKPAEETTTETTKIKTEEGGEETTEVTVSMASIQPTIGAHKRVIDAVAFFKKKFENMAKANLSDFQDFLKNFYATLTSRFMVSMLIIKNSKHAGQHFEVLNNRGKPLSNLEKVKNLLLYWNNVHDFKLDRQIIQCWTNIFTSFMKYNLRKIQLEDNFLRNMLQIIFNQKNGTYESFKQLFENNQDMEERKTKIEEFLRISSLCIKLFCSLASASSDRAFKFLKNKEVIKPMRRTTQLLNRFGILGTFCPLILSTYISDTRSKLKSQQISKNLLNLLQLLEKFCYCVFYLKQKRRDAGKGELLKLVNQLYMGASSPSDIYDTIISQMRKANALKANLKKSFDDIGPNTEAVKYLLFEYEHHLAPKNKLKYTDQHIRVARVLPEHTTIPGWLKAFPVKAYSKAVNQIGNFTLTTASHEDLKNTDFAQRKEEMYEASTLLCERELRKYDKWIPQAVNERSEKLISFAVQRFGVDPDDDIFVKQETVAEEEEEEEEYEESSSEEDQDEGLDLNEDGHSEAEEEAPEEDMSPGISGKRVRPKRAAAAKRKRTLETEEDGEEVGSPSREAGDLMTTQDDAVQESASKRMRQ